MLTRAHLNKYLPDKPELYRWAEEICGFSFGSVDHAVVRGLEWLANKTEAERYPSAEWVGLYPGEIALSVAFLDLAYKPTWGVMLMHGWGFAERCWIGTLQCGLEELITGETPALVVARCIILMTLMTEWRDTPPELRQRSLLQMIRAKVGAGSWRL